MDSGCKLTLFSGLSNYYLNYQFLGVGINEILFTLLLVTLLLVHPQNWMVGYNFCGLSFELHLVSEMLLFIDLIMLLVKQWMPFTRTAAHLCYSG